MADYLKGQIATITGINSETLRFYEKSKLIPPPARTKSGYRLYSDSALNRLQFIKNAKASGFTLNQIKELFAITENQDLDIKGFIRIVDQKIEEIDFRISSLKEIKDALISCKNRGEQSAQCPYIRAFLNNFKEE